MAGFKLTLLKDAKDFLQNIPQQAHKREKNNELFKKLDNTDIWEFRTLYNGISYRLFAFWDTDTQTLVVATHGIIKKTQKNTSKKNLKGRKLNERIF